MIPSMPGRNRSNAFPQLRVADAMHWGVVTCPSDAPLHVVARMMTTYRIHALIVFSEHRVTDPSEWEVVSDVDVLRRTLAGEIDSATAGETAASPVVIVAPDDPLDDAATLMAENRASHLIVVDPGSTRPVGVLSTLDLMHKLAGFS
jgi:CBS domain-containing protein